MPFTDDDLEFQSIGPIADLNGQTYVYPSAVISQEENLLMLKNAHRNYTIGNLARVFTLSGVHVEVGPDDDEPFYETTETDYQLVTRCPIYRVADRYDYGVFMDCYSGTIKIEVCDDAGLVLTYIEMGAGPDAREFDLQLITISDSYDIDDIMYLKVWLKLTPTSTGQAKLYHVVVYENNSET